jgi:hypothetical protein
MLNGVRLRSANSFKPAELIVFFERDAYFDWYNLKNGEEA